MESEAGPVRDTANFRIKKAQVSQLPHLAGWRERGSTTGHTPSLFNVLINVPS